MTRAELNAGGWGEYVWVGDTEIFFCLVKIRRGKSENFSKEEIFQINKKIMYTTLDIFDSRIYSHKPKSAVYTLLQNPLY